MGVFLIPKCHLKLNQDNSKTLARLIFIPIYL